MACKPDERLTQLFLELTRIDAVSSQELPVAEYIMDFVGKLGLEDCVIFPGHIRFSEILAYYRTADAFICMSEHEGFCVPLVEAMYFGVPIIADDSSAVPDTLGRGGLLLDNKDPSIAAAAIDRVLRDKKLRGWIRRGQEESLKRFHPLRAEEQMKACISRAIGIQRTGNGER